MTGRQQRKVGVLERRASHLEQRLAGAERPREASYMQAEVAALRWALELIAAAAAAGVLDELEARRGTS